MSADVYKYYIDSDGVPTWPIWCIARMHAAESRAVCWPSEVQGARAIVSVCRVRERVSH